MSSYAIFPDEKTAQAFVAKIDAAYGFPNADAQTYAIPEACKDGTYTVKIKDWLKADLGQSRKWCKTAAISECTKLPVASVLTEKPVLVADTVEAAVEK